ncbi:YeeE/YedE thiosulfate transporter family protein [Methanoregula sp.]|uniref:YeeE/YedE thiosulfate transporter family protein n=1 Tax=Methanoregula sp. TaxID=2052170 RepID=UPI002BCF30BD|nr:YeeE/YedE thiosulfate transporter family protein [Methanoregula sp.]HVP96189.1 YeeE/YedE thiosulfate transporter family protein [Methanoregula sp.]
MFDALFLPTWSPYAAGAGIGVVVCLSFFLCNRPLGSSSAYMKVWGLIEKAADPAVEEKKEFYREIPPRFDGVLMLLPGIFIGAFLSAALSGQFHLSWVPLLWAAAFGNNAILRVLVAFLGGIILALGARWAGGCTSGHGISGTSQLSLASIISAACFFIGGIITASVLFHAAGV